MLRFRRIKGSFGAVTVSLETIEPLLQDIIEIGHPVFDKTVQPLEPIFGIRHFALKAHNALVLTRSGTLAFQRRQHQREALRMKQPLDKAISNKTIELIHWIERRLHAVFPFRAHVEQV